MLFGAFEHSLVEVLQLSTGLPRKPLGVQLCLDELALDDQFLEVPNTVRSGESSRCASRSIHLLDVSDILCLER